VKPQLTSLSFAAGLLLSCLLTAGCGSSPTGANRPSDDGQAENSQPGSAKSGNRSARRDDEPSPEAERRLTLGPFSFLPPAGWEARETPEGITCFAPERPAWRQAGFRPNLGLRKRPHPGVALERYRNSLDQLLAQSAQQVNRQVSDFAQRTGDSKAKSIQLKESGKYTLDLRDVDGTKVLASTFSGIFQLPTGLTATKTHGLQFIGTDALYTVALTFPSDVETEMDAVWKAFQRDLRVTP
jgi:hypothetical protein